MKTFLRAYLTGNLRTLARDRCGAATIESALLAGIIGVLVIVAASELGSKVYQIFNSTAQLLEQTAKITSGDCGSGNGNGNCGNNGNGGGNTGGAGPGTGNGGDNNGRGDRADNDKDNDKNKGKQKGRDDDRDDDRDRKRGRDRNRD